MNNYNKFITFCLALFLLLIAILTSPLYAQTSKTVQYGYDNANQLQSADYDDGAGMPVDYDVNYSYDSSENRLSRDVLTQQNALANNPPGSFTLSSPTDAAPNVAYDITLTWTASSDPGDTVVYDVYLGEGSSPSLYKSSNATNSLQVNLLHGVTYYWKVVARDNHNASTSSLVWSFTTTVDTDGDGIADDGDNSGSTTDNPCLDLITLNCDDNCVSVFNPDQANSGGSSDGDACDTDIDGDGVLNGADNCPLIANPNQDDYDPPDPQLPDPPIYPDGIGDVCDADPDDDGVITGDNCPNDYNPDQTDVNNDGEGDACDTDIDQDAVLNVNDNCDYVKNSILYQWYDRIGIKHGNTQPDFDDDGIGNECDFDYDGDGISNAEDNCPLTPNASVFGICIGGTNDRKYCEKHDECPGGSCSLKSGTCVGGADNGLFCTDNEVGTCPGGLCSLNQDVDSEGYAVACWEIHEVDTSAAFQTALNTSKSNKKHDLIKLKQGVYSVADNIVADARFDYATAYTEHYNLYIRGGYDNTYSGSARSPDPATTIIDGTKLDSSRIPIILNIFDQGNVSFDEWLYIPEAVIEIDGLTVENGKQGIWLSSTYGDIRVTNNIVRNNIGTSNSGGVDAYVGEGRLLVSNNNIKDNQANNLTGLNLKTTNGSIEVLNNIITNNSALTSWAGGAYIYASGGSSQVRIVNNTITGNSSFNNGGGLFLRFLDSSSTAGIYNNIIWGNSAPTGADIYLFGISTGIYTAYNNNYNQLYGTFDFFAGNDTVNAPVFMGGGDYHLSSTSINQINTGTNETPFLPETDFDGNARIFNGTVDRGAYEAVSDVTLVPVTHDFGAELLGSSTDQLFTVTNDGNDDLDAIVINTPASPYSIVNDLCTGQVVAPTANCSFSVRFAPTISGSYPDSFSVGSNDPDEPTVLITLAGIGNAAPVASMQGISDTYEGVEITLDGSGSTDDFSSISTYDWDIDYDGASFASDYSSASSTQPHTYLADGVYSIMLRVTDNYGATDFLDVPVTVNILDDGPTAEFTEDKRSGPASLSVTFTDDSTSYDPPLSYEWYMDYDNYPARVDSILANPTYTYEAAGSYSVKLRVVELDGDQNSIVKTNHITVTLPENTLEVNKLGLGSGTVASSPAGIDCGVDCSEIYIGEPLITLSAVPNAGSEFAGWSGVVCEGGAQSAQSGGSELMISAPLFGGGGGTAQASSSSSMNTCDVSLDVSNTTSTTAIASFNLCANLPVRVVGAQDYTTVQAGYAAAPEGGTIQVQAGRFIESPDMNIDKTVTIQGGYDCDYLGVIGITLIKGNLTISDGAVTVSDIEIEP